MNIAQLLFSFNGRLNRQGFWIGFGVNFVFLFMFTNFFINPTAFSLLSVVPLLISLYSLSAVIVKRLHDRNRSGKALLMALMPFVCYAASLGTTGIMQLILGWAMPAFIATVLLMEWGVFKGNPEANPYGRQGVSLKLR